MYLYTYTCGCKRMSITQITFLFFPAYCMGCAPKAGCWGIFALMTSWHFWGHVEKLWRKNQPSTSTDVSQHRISLQQSKQETWEKMGTWEHGSSGIGCSLDGLGYSPFLLNSDDAENKWADLKCVFYCVSLCPCRCGDYSNDKHMKIVWR